MLRGCCGEFCGAEGGLGAGWERTWLGGPGLVAATRGSTLCWGSLEGVGSWGPQGLLFKYRPTWGHSSLPTIPKTRPVCMDSFQILHVPSQASPHTPQKSPPITPLQAARAAPFPSGSLSPSRFLGQSALSTSTSYSRCCFWAPWPHPLIASALVLAAW